MLAPRDLPLLPVFVAVATAGSFTQAGRALGLTKSVVSHHVRALEARCGVRLLERTSRAVRLTQAGEQVLDAAKDVLASVKALERAVERQRDAPAGALRVTLPADPGLSAMVAPIAAALTRAHPALTVEFTFDDARRDLVAEGYDLAIRLGAMTSSGHVMRRLGTEAEVVVASPGALAAADPPAHPKELADAPWVVHHAQGARGLWTLRSERGERQQLSVRVVATVNASNAARDLLVAGAGYGVLPWHVVHDDVRAGRLCRVCPGWIHRELTLHALLPTTRSPPRVRAFLDSLRDAAPPAGFTPPRRSPARGA
jgi:DNA-binding transcriptional LysR family regulator